MQNNPSNFPESNSEFALATEAESSSKLPLISPFSSSNPDWLRSFKGCENYSDEETLIISESLRTLAKILLESVQNDTNNNDNQATEHSIIILNNQKEAA